MNSTSHVGAVGELFIANYFLSYGLEVCRNVAASGPVDLIVFNRETGKMVAIDVKSLRSCYTKVDGTLSLPKNPGWDEKNIATVVYVHGEASARLPEAFWQVLGMETAE